MAEVYGGDFAYARPDPRALRDSGYTFVVGYISRNSRKCLTDWERYAQAGLGVAFVFEDSAVPDHGAGTADGRFCEQWLRAHGAPMDAPLFFAIDADIPATEFPAVAGYGRDFNLATNSPVGPYGKYALVDALVTPGRQPMQLGWQTAAWSGDQVSEKANLYQRCTPHHLVAGLADGDYDEDVLIRPLAFAQAAAEVNIGEASPNLTAMVRGLGRTPEGYGHG
jgi:hypothetical protein